MSQRPEHGEGNEAPLKAVYHVGVGVVLAIILVGTVNKVAGEPYVEEPVSALQPVGPVAAESEAPAIDELPCFTCHSLVTYAEGSETAFPHEFHYEMFDMVEQPDCHLCHAFVGHRVVINREPCADCH